MKRKGIVASILAVFMSVTMIMPVFADAQYIDEDKDISGWGDQHKEDKVYVRGDYTLTVNEGKEVSVGAIYGYNPEGIDNYSLHDVTITGGGTLNTGTQQGSDVGIYGKNINIENITVNANGFILGIEARNNVNIIGSTVNATGKYIGIAANQGSITISDSNVTAKGTGEESRGIAAWEGLSINNSDVTADGGEKAIITEGDITLTNASVVEGSYEGTHVVINRTGAAAPILNPVPQSNDNSSSSSDGGTVCASIAQMITEAA